MTPEEILAVEKNIVLTLKNIYDPEIPVNIYDLGLIYEINYDPAGTADIIMTLTAPNCPMADMLLADINREVGKVDGVEKVNITLTFDPQWDKSMMSEEALIELNLKVVLNRELKSINHPVVIHAFIIVIFVVFVYYM